MFYRKEQPKLYSEKIVYYAPKTFIKSNIIDGLCIDFTDLKYLPREECQKPNSKIWKIAMWGGMYDWQLVQSFNGKNVGQLLSQGEFVKGLGLQFLDKSTTKPIIDNEIPQKYVKPQSIERFITSSFSKLNDGLTDESKKLYADYYKTTKDKLPPINVFRRIGAKGTFKAPHILIKEGLSNWEICASYLGNNCSFNSKVIGIHHLDSQLLKGLVCYINSKFALYYIFLTSASIGIEREEIKPNELYSLPLFLETVDLYKLAKLFDEYVIDNQFSRHQNIDILEQKVDEYVFEKLSSFKQVETNIIEDFILYTVPLLKKDTMAIGLHPNIDNVKNYCIKLGNKLNDFLSGQGLFVNVTIYNINRFTPLMMIKLSFDKKQKEFAISKEFVNNELKKVDKYLWEEKSNNIYFRKKLNYKIGNDIYIIRPNQRRFWSQSMALEDASELILEILNGN